MTPIDKNVLTGQSYFDAVSDEMRKRGFVLFSQVVTDQADGFRYHVPVDIARNTRLFFHYPNTNLIVMLDYNEDDYMERGSVKGRWNIQADYEFLPAEQLVKMTLVPYEERDTSDFFDEWAGAFRKVPLLDYIPDGDNYPDFIFHCNKLAQLYPPNEPTDPAKIAENVWGYVGEAIPYLSRAPFSKLQVTCFAPNYIFPHADELFWERFKESSAKISTSRYLWSLVRRPWGSNGLKR